jgi:hypothetical protein
LHSEATINVLAKNLSYYSHRLTIKIWSRQQWLAAMKTKRYKIQVMRNSMLLDSFGKSSNRIELHVMRLEFPGIVAHVVFVTVRAIEITARRHLDDKARKRLGGRKRRGRI